MQTIAIDFDGVIHRYSRGWYDGTCYDVPIEGAYDAIQELRNKYAVFIFSAREPSSILQWLSKRFPQLPAEIIPSTETFYNNPSKVGITQRKLPAFAYIDDRGVHFNSWKQTLEIIRSRQFDEDCNKGKFVVTPPPKAEAAINYQRI